ncbi:serine hydrolase [Phycicoccus sp. HDW14]|uniref:serine hydrolase domain-containing protein n=1 Tax=Phycicoccus sp. HDW14 TaxID=2714941 RepID=UPI0014083501|nr:serine hydrolase [Phycicoccus sp. HDW14]QIM22280.1 serine hydrolase [Phycicoccus sp. HDW14]
MRVLRRVLAVLLVLVVVGAVFGYRHYRPLLETGTGYAAHNSCAVALVAGRDDPDTDLPPNPLVPYLTGYVNLAGKSSTSAVWWLLAKQKAFYTQGYGCTVAGERPTVSRRATKVETEGNPFAEVPAPETDPALQEVVARAFGDDLSATRKKALGTRAVVVIRDGKLVAERYADGFTADTPQLGWSMAKSATNLLVGRYVLDRGLDIQESGLRPEWTDERKAITVDQLMRMTSGLRWDETYDLGTPITQMLYAEPDMAKYVASQPLAHQPGTYQQYSSGSTNLVCSWLSSLADVPDTDFPRTELFAPSACPRPSGSPTPPATRCAPPTSGPPRATGGPGPVRPPGRRLGRQAAAAGGLDGAVDHGPAGRPHRGEGLRRRLVGQQGGRRLARQLAAAGRRVLGQRPRRPAGLRRAVAAAGRRAARVLARGRRVGAAHRRARARRHRRGADLLTRGPVRRSG